MLKLRSEITIEGDKTWRFSAVSECQIIEDISNLTDTCELKLPKKVSWEEAVMINGKPPVKRGDRITVKLGYNKDLQVRFTGYVRSVDSKVPITIKCEDGMFLLKTQKAKPKAFKKASLNDILKHLLDDTGIKYTLIDKSIMVGNWRITKATVAEELQELKEKQMLSSYFRRINNQSVLYVGLAYPADNRKKVKIMYGKNLITEDFEYRDKADIRARVEAQTFNAKHKKTEIEIGDKDGDVLKIRIDGITETELKKYAQQALDRYKQSGFKGSFETFGQPEIYKCDMVDITASDSNSGVYLVKKNETTFGMSGYRQKIELGQPLSLK